MWKRKDTRGQDVLRAINQIDSVHRERLHGKMMEACKAANEARDKYIRVLIDEPGKFDLIADARLSCSITMHDAEEAVDNWWKCGSPRC